MRISAGDGDELDTAWAIPSSSGDHNVRFELRGTEPGTPDATIWRVIVTTTAEHELRIDGLAVNLRNLVALSSLLRRWLTDTTPFVHVLSASLGERLALRVGPDPGVISDRHKPALFLEYHGAALVARAFTVLDETCIRIAADGLDAALKTLAGYGVDATPDSNSAP
jgi:hypothetical protein